jgi:two-component system, OmpR family, phosphate regulon response regulator PhoB
MPSLKPSILIVREGKRPSLAKHVLEKDCCRTSSAGKIGAPSALADADPDLIFLGSPSDKSSALAECSRMLQAGGFRHLPIVRLPQSEEHRPRNVDTSVNSDQAIDDTQTVSGQLLARIGAIGSPSSSEHRSVLTFLDLRMDLRAQLVYRNGRRVALGPLEFRLLEYFLRYPRCVFSRKELLESVWGRNLHVVSRTVDVHIGRLRKVLNATGLPDYIRTVHGRGYSLDSLD